MRAEIAGSGFPVIQSSTYPERSEVKVRDPALPPECSVKGGVGYVRDPRPLHAPFAQYYNAVVVLGFGRGSGGTCRVPLLPAHTFGKVRDCVLQLLAPLAGKTGTF